jgi:hypothetical protein
MLPDTRKRPPYPLNWDEQQNLFSALPPQLAEMALFAVNTGCRDAEICKLQWDWEVQVPPLETFVFIVPGSFVKNGDERLIVLNDIARSIVNARRGKHPTHVFAYQGKPVTRMLNSSWCRVRKEVGLPQVRVHDLKHTLGRRLRAAGVSFEDRQDLLGHRSGRMTTHYSAAELSKLIEAANSVCERNVNERRSRNEFISSLQLVQLPSQRRDGRQSIRVGRSVAVRHDPKKLCVSLSVACVSRKRCDGAARLTQRILAISGKLICEFLGVLQHNLPNRRVFCVAWSCSPDLCRAA